MVKISVVIITRNRSFILGDCLKALHPQIDFSKHEVVVVDSSEKDDTAVLIKDFPWVQYHRISLPLGTRPQSYSFGAKTAKGEIVALLDDDAIVFPHWLEQIEKAYREPKTGAAGGRVLPKDELSIPMERNDMPIGLANTRGDFIGNLYLKPSQPREIDTLRGCNMSVRRDLLEAMNFFDARFRGQNCRVEDDICFWVKRMGYRVIFDPLCVVRHLAEERPDVPRSEYNMTSEFYVWRNTVWLFSKHFGVNLPVMIKTGILKPFITGLRRCMGGSLKRININRESLKYFPAFSAGVVGGLWGILMSLVYWIPESFQDCQKKYPRFGSRLKLLGEGYFAA